jgi:hypothetical protein
MYKITANGLWLLVTKSLLIKYEAGLQSESRVILIRWWDSCFSWTYLIRLLEQRNRTIAKCSVVLELEYAGVQCTRRYWKLQYTNTSPATRSSPCI